MKLKYYHNLDGMRGIAALMVVIYHFFANGNANYLHNLSIYQKITEFGQHGVSLFFVLSGFVITRILINTRENSNYFSSFYWKRILRILPLYYFFLLIQYLVIPIVFNKEFVDFKLQMPYYFYLQNLTEVLNINASGPGHYWSLAVEEHFYLLWPLAIFIFSPKYLVKLIGIIIILIFVLKYFMIAKGYSINYFTFTRIDQLLMGALLAVLEYRDFFKSINALPKMIMVGLGVFPLGIIVYIVSLDFHTIKEMMKYPILGLFFFSVLGCLVALKENNILNKILSGKILQYLGRISYGIYVWHILSLFILSKVLICKIMILDLFLTIGLSVLFAHFSYFYFEKYFLNLKDSKPTLKNIFAFLRVQKKL